MSGSLPPRLTARHRFDLNVETQVRRRMAGLQRWGRRPAFVTAQAASAIRGVTSGKSITGFATRLK
jgi:hypothetical protein